MKYTKFSLILPLLALLTGCIRDTLDNCNTTFRLLFSYTGDGTQELFNEKITHGDLFVFDENHKPVLTHELTAEQLESRSVELSLPDGTYHAVCVGNGHDAAWLALEEGTTFDTKIVHPVTHPDIETGDQRVDSHGHLYQGYTPLALTRVDGAEHTIELAAAHIDMVVEVAGYHAGEEPPLYIEHANLPAWTDFSNLCAPEEIVSHFPEAEFREGVYVHTYNVMRGLEDSQIHLHTTEGELLHTVDVMEFLAEHPEIDPYLHEVLVPIRIEFKNLEVVVTVPEWAIKDTKPEF